MKRSIADVMLRPLSFAICLFASACGGGGDTSDAAAAQPLAGFAGYYSFRSADVADNTFGEVLVHPDGTTVGTISTAGMGGVTLAGNSFAGSFAASGSQVFANSTLFVRESGATEPGKADITMAQGTSADQKTLTVSVTNSTVPNAFPVRTYTGAPVSVAFRNLPLQKLGGTYLGSGGPPPTFQNVSVDAATGVVNGVYASDGGASQCVIAGKLSGYDPTTTMFRLAANFSGPACTDYGVPAGNGDFVGVLESSRFGHLVLRARGIMSGRYVTVSLVHSQQLGTY